jgi:hypothetical protein
MSLGSPDYRIADIDVSVSDNLRDISVVIEPLDETIITAPTVVPPVVAAVIDPVELRVSIDVKQGFQVVIDPPAQPVVVVEPPLIPIVTTANIGPRGPQGAVEIYEQPDQPPDTAGDGSLWFDIDDSVPTGPTGPPGPVGPQGPPGAAAKWAQLTQAQYDALSPPDPNTLYVIVG